MWRMPRGELRACLGFDIYTRSAYRHRVSLVAANLYMAGNQRTARELIRFLQSGGACPLRPIDPRRRWWSQADQRILNALFRKYHLYSCLPSVCPVLCYLILPF